MDDLRGKQVTVAGLGHFGGGIAVCRWLVEQGADVLATDHALAEKLANALQQLHGLPIQYRLGEHREADFTGADLLVVSPAIKPDNPFLLAARQAGVPITTEIRLFIERCPARIVGVTGTKGKSTTTALLGGMLQTRFKTWVGGNIGTSLLPDLPRIAPSDLVVVELSSFMLHYMEPMHWSPHVAVITLLGTDHLEWHGSAEAYIEAKKNLLRFQQASDYAVLNADDAPSRKLISGARAEVIPFAKTGPKDFALKLPGKHNQANAQAAFSAAGIFGVTWDEAQMAITDFPGLPHRLQLVHEANGVRYFDDSNATIPNAAIAALESFPPGTVIQIVGGHDKGLPFDEMCAALARRAKAAICIGAAGPKIRAILGKCPTAAPIHQCVDLPTAMRQAKAIAAPGDVVLLSPGCASFGEFAHFEDRGGQFIRLTRTTP